MAISANAVLTNGDNCIIKSPSCWYLLEAIAIIVQNKGGHKRYISSGPREISTTGKNGWYFSTNSLNKFWMVSMVNVNPSMVFGEHDQSLTRFWEACATGGGGGGGGSGRLCGKYVGEGNDRGSGWIKFCNGTAPGGDMVVLSWLSIALLLSASISRSSWTILNRLEVRLKFGSSLHSSDFLVHLEQGFGLLSWASHRT